MPPENHSLGHVGEDRSTFCARSYSSRFRWDSMRSSSLCFIFSRRRSSSRNTPLYIDYFADIHISMSFKASKGKGAHLVPDVAGNERRI